MHLANAEEDEAAYTYYKNDSGKWVTTKSYKMSDAIKSENWDFISFQHSSPRSGMPAKYDDLEKIIPIVESQCTNPKLEFIWHMTWAYQSNSTNSSFSSYDWNQDTMYNAIVDAVKQCVVSCKKITRIVPNGTVIQNARTSYLGDNLTRDGYHLSKDQGRVIAGITMMAATIGIGYDNIDLSAVSEDEQFVKVALESVENAMKNPFEVTKSAYTK